MLLEKKHMVCYNKRDVEKFWIEDGDTKQMKKKLKKILKSQNIIYTALCFIIVLIVVVLHLALKIELDITSMFDIGLFSTVVLVFIVNSIALGFASFYEAKQEDEEKLTQDYDALSKIYIRDVRLVKHSNKYSALINIKKGRKHTRCKYKIINGVDTYTIPAANPIYLRDKQVEIFDDKNKQYKLPEQIANFSDKLLKAHNYSKIYNQLNIRLDGITETEEKVVLKCSRTTYFDSLMTTRAMDFNIDGTTVRNMFLYGPFLATLEESQLSNHLGYNGFVETKDNYFVFILRHKNVSVSKNTLQISVGASLKSKYALNDDKELTKDGILNAIREEIVDELNLDKLDNYNERKSEIFAEFSFDSIYYAYRELVEGGKPQLLFYTKINVNLDELKKAYSAGVCKRNIRKNKETSLKVDGYKALFVHRDQMKDIYVSPDGFTIRGKFYKAAPTMTASFSLLIEKIL